MKENARVTPVNKYNFLRFYPTNVTALDQSKYANEVHNGFQYRWRNIFDPLPALKGDILRFHTNFSEEVAFVTDVFVAVDPNGNLLINPADISLTSQRIGDTNNFIISVFIPPSSSIKNGTPIRAGIFETGFGGTIKYLSNCFEVYDYTERNIRGTHILTFEHDNDIYNYDWTQRSEAQPPYVVRVNSNLASIAYPSDDAVYKSSTTGKPRKTRSVIDKQIQFETYYASEDFHDAFNMAVHLKDFYVNGTKMIKDGSYEVSYNKIFNLSKGTINLLDTRYSIRVDRCTDLVPPEPEPEPTYTLTVLADPVAGGAAVDNTDGSPYEAGDSVSVTATANPTWEFVSWTVGGDVVSTNPSFTYTMPAANTTLVANFAEIDPILNYLMFELSGEEDDVFIDANLRIIVDGVTLAEVFGNNEGGTLTLSPGDTVQLQYFYLAGEGAGMDEGLTSPTIRIIVEEDSSIIVNESNLIVNPDNNLTLNQFITVNAGSTYNVTVDTFDAG